MRPALFVENDARLLVTNEPKFFGSLVRSGADVPD